jgi:hypothetical protein
MTAIVLPDVDRSTIDELRKRIPNLSEIELAKVELPTMQDVGKTADKAIDRLLGRSRAPIWPWVAAGVGLVAVVSVVAAWFAWFRRPAWQNQTSWKPGSVPAAEDDIAVTDAGMAPATTPTTPIGHGLTAAEASLTSTPYPIEEA